jgi:hypothetical protein
MTDELGLSGRLFDRLIAPEPSYALVRFVVLRSLGLVYFSAFLAAALQIVPLVGEDGILPATRLLDAAVREGGGTLGAFRRLPTLFLITGPTDAALSAVSWIGVALSAAVLLGATNAALMVVLWALYVSIVHVGQVFYGYGWEIQLLETGLVAALLCPLRSLHPLPARPPPIFAVWMMRWLIVRVMLGAGLIKLRGDPCWADLSCLEHHYETQPIPGPLSPLLHAMPSWFHQGGVLFNHLVELVAPLFAFGPAPARRVAGALFVLFQLILIASGNLAFLNWLTIVPALACFDDGILSRVLPRRLVAVARARTTSAEASRGSLWASGAWGIIVVFLSIQPVANLLSPRQAMNRSFDPLHLVNTYGAFGSVGKTRYEIVVSGTHAELPDDEADWIEVTLPCKPGPVDRAPCWITPYHLRLDWQMWFLPFSPAERNPWFLSFVDKLLAGSRAIDPLLDQDPFSERPPRWVKADAYVYGFAEDGRTWQRSWKATYLRPVDRADPDLARALQAWGLGPEKPRSLP